MSAFDEGGARSGGGSGGPGGGLRSGFGGLGEARPVAVDVYTAAYRVSGEVETRFSRVTEILNQLTGGHLALERATVSEYTDPSAPLATPSALVAVDEILVMIAAGLGGGPPSEMRIPKRPVLAHFTLPPFRITGRVHVPVDSRSVDGVLLGHDRFLAMTDATIASGVHPELGRRAEVLALRRDRAHVLLVADDEDAEELLAGVLGARTAATWRRSDEPTEGADRDQAG